MSDPANEPSFRLEIAGLPEPFVVAAFMGSEAISEPFSHEVELLPGSTPPDLAGLLYRSVWLSFGSRARASTGSSTNWFSTVPTPVAACVSGRSWPAWRSASASGY